MKLTSLILSLAIAAGCALPASAEDNLEKIISDVKIRAGIGEYEDFSSNFYTDDSGKKTYSLSWENRDDENYDYLGVSYCDGFILSYYHSFDYDYNSETKFPQVSYDDARQTAEAFVKNINPEYSEHIVIEADSRENLASGNYFFRLQRYENGLPVLYNAGEINVNKQNNSVENFYMNYDTDATFTPADAVISEDKAIEAYKKSFAPKLRYSIYYDNEKKTCNVYPEYVSNEGLKVINALDGSVYDAASEKERGVEANEAYMSKGEAAKDAGMTLSPSEIKEVENISGLITQADAEKLVRGNKTIALPKDCTIDSIYLNRDYMNPSNYVYHIYFGGDKFYGGADVDAKTGEILSFHKPGDYSEDEKHNVDSEKKVAEAAFSALAGKKADEYEFTDAKDGYVLYTRKYNSIEVSSDIADFSFDGKGNLISYSKIYTDGTEFPSVEGVLSTDKACDRVFEQKEYKLMYMANSDDKPFVPVFCIDGEVSPINFKLNPFTGNLIDYQGKDVEDTNAEGITYSDIDGHYGKEKFEKLALFGIGFPGGVLDPDAGITQNEFLTLLSSVFYGYEDPIVICKRYISSGMTTAEAVEKNLPVTREDAAIFMVREMGAEAYAQYNDIYIAPFKDVTENKGYIALLKAMGVFSGDQDGNFNPKNTITRGEALIMLYNYLNR